MRSNIFRARWLLKFLILIPLTVIVILNMQLIFQIKDVSSFYSLIQSIESSPPLPSPQAINKLSSDIINSKNVVRRPSSPKGLIDLNAQELAKEKRPPRNWTVKEIRDQVELANKKPFIRNRHLIADILREEAAPASNSEEADEEEEQEATTTMTATSKRGVQQLSPVVGVEQNIDNSEIDPDATIQALTSPGKSVSHARTITPKLYELPKLLVIVIQIHSRLNYLKDLVDSLRDVKSIENSLVIFSHDFYEPEINEFVQSIDFCATLQIFYPYSIQLYPNEFPGQDPKDCPKTVEKADALLMKCQNAAHPDQYGNYREAKMAQIKHHWIWKLGFVFEQFNETLALDNLHVLLLEEDHYLFPDALHSLKILAEKIMSDIDVVSLAHFEQQRQPFDRRRIKKYAKAIWHSSMHNTGLLLSRKQWRMIKDCQAAFCSYDDYNWDWSLQHLSQKCFHLPLVAIYPVYSRVVHMGTCGLHHKDKNCDTKENVNKLNSQFRESASSFFPNKFELTNVNPVIRRIRNPNGGWSDPRDMQLCKSFFGNFTFAIQDLEL